VFLRQLVDRALKGVELVNSGACRGLVESLKEYLSARGVGVSRLRCALQVRLMLTVA
jgi:hypothetical protein